MATLAFEIELPATPEALFRFHADPLNLQRLMEGWPGFRLVRHDGPLREGGEVWVEQTFAGFLPVVTAVRHRDVRPPRGFTDELVHGPFSRFVHVHEFAPSPGGAVVRDRVEVELPRHLGGAFVCARIVVPRVERMFAHRHRRMRELFVRR